MNRLLVVLSIFVLSCSNPSFKKDQIAIVPKPNQMSLAEESFRISSGTKIIAPDDNQQKAVKYLNGLFDSAAGFILDIQENSDQKGIVFQQVEGLASEAYQLDVSPDRILISASGEAGYFYAVQSLRQLLPHAIESKEVVSADWLVPSVKIEDEPRFAWRGMHMDFSRHFFDIDEVKIFLDYMALYKLNTYHMHLTDDEGWRIEIKQLPLLTEKGAWRTVSRHDKVCIDNAKTDPSYTIDPEKYHMKDGKKMYGGFFTQEQIKEIIQYADERCITVIPEIDMPGHFKAAIDNYPYLSCKDKAGWGKVFTTPACLGKETTYQFVETILGEVAELFPSEYIHIGGDEVNIQSWKDCAKCQVEIRKHHLKNEHELQSYFNRRIEKFLKSKGKQLMGWDEITEGGLSEDAHVMWWRNWAPEALSKAVTNGNKMIITPGTPYYFDAKNEVTPLKRVYEYEPVPSKFTSTQENLVMGIQANLWAEWIPNFERLQYQAFPRILALSETAWANKESKDYDEFNTRVQLHSDRMDVMNINYYIPSVAGLNKKIAFVDSAIINLSVPMKGLEIYYSLDGSVPTKESKLYNKPIILKANCEIKARAFKGNTGSGLAKAVVEKQSLRDAQTVSPEKGKLKRWVVKNHPDAVKKVDLNKSNDWKLVSQIGLEEYSKEEKIFMAFQGYFYAENDGVYEFFTKSDDGSLLYIEDEMVVDNGGHHAPRERSGMIALAKGWHPISIYFQQGTGGSELNVWYEYDMNKNCELKGNIVGY